MYKLSDLIGKEAITLTDAKKQGVIFNAHFDESLRLLKYFTLINHDEEIRWVEYKNVLSYSLDAVIIRASSDILDESASLTVQSPINLKAFNQDGKMLGFIRDIEMDNGRVVKFITDSGETELLQLLSISDEILVFNDTGKPIKLKTERKSVQKKESAPKDDFIKPIEASANEIKVEPKAPSDIQKIPLEKTEVYRSPQIQPATRYSFLLGKRLQRDIFDCSGVCLAHENDLINERIIVRAKQAGRLVTLALHSL